LVIQHVVVLSTAHPQAQTSPTENGGGLRRGAAGDERLPSYLTSGAKCLSTEQQTCAFLLNDFYKLNPIFSNILVFDDL